MTHTPATVLRDAAQWLDNDPKRWGRDAFLSPVDKCRCAAGAIAWVLSPLDIEANPMNLRASAENGEIGQYTTAVLADYLIDHCAAPMLDDPIEVIANWNDDPLNTAVNVIKTMRAAADEWDHRQKERAAA